MAYPATLSVFTDQIDGTDNADAVDINVVYASLRALEAKIGVDNSAVAGTIDRLLKSTASVDPGHKHSPASLTYSSLTAGHALFASSSTAAGFRAIQETDIVNAGLLARVNDNETITGTWTFNTSRPVFKQGIELGGSGSEAVRHLAAAGAGTVTYTWSSTFTAGQVLQVNAGGVLSWVSGGGGGGVTGTGTDNRIVRWDGTTAVQSTGWQINDSDQLSMTNSDTVVSGFVFPDFVLKRTVQPSSNSSLSRSVMSVTVEADGTSNLTAGTGLTALSVIASHEGTGTVTQLNGASIQAFKNDTGPVTSIDGLRIIVGNNNATGNVTTATGLRIRAPFAAGTNVEYFPIYVETAPLGVVSLGVPLQIRGFTSGSVSFLAQNVTTSHIWGLPAAMGSIGQVLTVADGGGNLVWQTPSGAGGPVSLNSIVGASGTNTMSSSSHAQVWNWSLGSGTLVGFTFAESTPATGASTLLRVLGAATSTAKTASIEHPDVTSGKVLEVLGGAVRMRARFVAVGPAADWVTVDSTNFDAAVHVVGVTVPPSAYTSARKVGLLTTNQSGILLPTSRPTNMHQALVHFAFEAHMACVTSNTTSYNVSSAGVEPVTWYGIDSSLEFDGNQPQLKHAVALTGTINFHTASRVTGSQVGVLSIVKNWDNTNNGATPVVLFQGAPCGWRNEASPTFGPWGGLSPTQGVLLIPPSGVLYGLALPEVDSGSALNTHTTAQCGFRQYKPLYIPSDVGWSVHEPRIQFGSIFATDVGALFGGAAGSATACVTIEARDSRGVSDVTEDKYILALLGIETATPPFGHIPRAAFYREGGLRLMAQAAPVESVLGYMYVDSDDNKLYYYNGSTFVDLSGGGGSASGWQDDGTTVRLVTTTDKVRIDTTSSVRAHQLIIGDDGDSGQLGLGHGSSNVVAVHNTSAAVIAALTITGGVYSTSTLQCRDTAGASRFDVEVDTSGTRIGIGNTAGNLILTGAARNVVAMQNGVVPSTSAADSFQLYSKDAAAGKAWPHFRPEDGVPRIFLGVESAQAASTATITIKAASGGTAKNSDGWMKTHLPDGSIVHIPYVIDPNS